MRMGDVGLPPDGVDMQNFANETSQFVSKEVPMTAEDYSKKVTGWAIFGYHPPININGEKFDAEKSFNASGKNKELLDYVPGGQVEAVIKVIGSINSSWQAERGGFENPSRDMYVAIVDAENKSDEKYSNQKIILIGLFHDDTNSNAGRSNPKETYSLIGFSMPSDIADKFIGQTQLDPDIVNDVLEKSLTGLDSTPDQSGIERYKAYNLVRLTNDKIDSVVQKKVDPFDRGQLPAFLSGLPREPFKNGPYGVKDYIK